MSTILTINVNFSKNIFTIHFGDHKNTLAMARRSARHAD